MTNSHKPKGMISPDMTLLEIVDQHRDTVEILRSYDDRAGTCLMCEHLFDTLEEVTAKHGLNLNEILEKLNKP